MRSRTRMRALMIFIRSCRHRDVADAVVLLCSAWVFQKAACCSVADDVEHTACGSRAEGCGRGCVVSVTRPAFAADDRRISWTGSIRISTGGPRHTASCFVGRSSRDIANSCCAKRCVSRGIAQPAASAICVRDRGRTWSSSVQVAAGCLRHTAGCLIRCCAGNVARCSSAKQRGCCWICEKAGSTLAVGNGRSARPLAIGVSARGPGDAARRIVFWCARDVADSSPAPGSRCGRVVQLPSSAIRVRHRRRACALAVGVAAGGLGDAARR